MALGHGERWWVHRALRPRSLQLTATPDGRAASVSYDLHPPRGASLRDLPSPPPCPSKWSSRYAGPRRHTQAEWAWGKNLAELDLRICVPVVESKGESEIRGYHPKTPPSVRGEAAGLPGRFEDQAQPGRLQPSTLRSPVPFPAVSRQRRFRQPTRPGLSPRPDHPPRGALTAQRVPPLPPPSPKWRRRPPILLVAFL